LVGGARQLVFESAEPVMGCRAGIVEEAHDDAILQQTREDKGRPRAADEKLAGEDKVAGYDQGEAQDATHNRSRDRGGKACASAHSPLRPSPLADARGKVHLPRKRGRKETSLSSPACGGDGERTT
jgi:hypothetical protein